MNSRRAPRTTDLIILLLESTVHSLEYLCILRARTTLCIVVCILASSAWNHGSSKLLLARVCIRARNT